MSIATQLNKIITNQEAQLAELKAINVGIDLLTAKQDTANQNLGIIADNTTKLVKELAPDAVVGIEVTPGEPTNR